MGKKRFKSQSPKTRENKHRARDYIASNPNCTKANIREALDLTLNEIEFILKFLRAGKYVVMNRVDGEKVFTYTVTDKVLTDGVDNEEVLPNARVFRLSDREPSAEMREEMRKRRKQIKNTPYAGSSMSMFEGW